MRLFTLDKGIIPKHYVNYYLKWNGLVKFTNKNLVQIMKIPIEDHHKRWHSFVLVLFGKIE
jgi:hypothetical protein